ncbi:MAG: PKD domain-containing protein [Euryarchaeota archaeon]|nr:PKD domain-containing protein [Euryarchaeota archaeon]
MRKNVIAMSIVGMLLLASFIIAPAVVADDGNTIYVDDNAAPSWYNATHVKTIQEGINNASAGDTIFVYSGIYHENIIINKSVNLIGKDGYPVINPGHDADPDSVVNISANNVNIIGFSIENDIYGIGIYNSSNNVIKNNTIKDTDCGIYIENISDGNIIYHNNFLNNIQNANDSGINTWDNGYPSGGNYWDDYTGTDGNGDGIGDTQYNISDVTGVNNNKDFYPLIYPFGENPPVADFKYIINNFTATFTSLSYDRDGTIANYTWNFGDGKGSFEQNPTHTYAGEYTAYNVTLNITDNDGRKGTIYKYVTTNDTTPPTIQIIKPERALYMGNHKIRRLFLRMALVIGDITVEVNATDSGSGIAKVEFYINGKLKGNDTTAPYTYNLTKDKLLRFVHMQIIKVVAYDKAGNSAVAKMIVKKYL